MNVDDLLKSKVGQNPRNRAALEQAKAELGGSAPVTRVGELEMPQPVVKPTELPDWMPNPAKYFDEVSAQDIICRGVFLGEPIPKQRARIGKHGGYTPKSTKDYQRAIASSVVSQLILPPKPNVAVGIRAAFYTRTRQRKDVDNMLKAVLDALNHLAFCDDSQIKEVMAWSAMDCLNPRTEFLVYRLGSIRNDKGVCLQCSKPFVQTKDWKLRLFCSRECWLKSKEDARVGVCLQCGAPIVSRPYNDQKFCSFKCKGLAERTRVKLLCALCGTAFEVRQSDIGKGAKFCSRDCYNKAKIGHPRVGKNREQILA